MKTFNKYYIFTIISFFILHSGCIKDNITPPLTGNLNPVGKMLVYFEEQGDFTNSSQAPALVNADEVNTNLGSYLIIDIRSPSDFSEGHIEGSVNIQSDSLYNYFENLDAGKYYKIVLVSKNGQSSAYFVCLLRLAGFNNVYTLNFGLASWNEHFSDDWLGAIGDASDIERYTNDPVPKGDYTNLPDIMFENPDAPIEQNVKSRIKQTMSAGFIQDINFERVIPEIGTMYIVCYALNGLLYYSPRFGPFSELGHDPDARYYMSDPLFELRAVNYLQTLPPEDKILIYDETGQMGACMTAYLRVLGYNAVTLLFGGNQLIHSRMIYYQEIQQFAFDDSDIKNYPYVTGE